MLVEIMSRLGEEESLTDVCGGSWFVLGQLFASVALNRLNASDPYDFKVAIYTQVNENPRVTKSLLVSCTDLHQWGMIGVILIIFLLVPESPWWLASKGKTEKASKVLHQCYSGVEGYDIPQQIVSPVDLWSCIRVY